jgi:diaminopimelate decarboxylase
VRPGPHLLWQHDQKERDIARAFALGIRLFAVDCAAEVEKISRAAPGAKVFCRILYDCAGAEWPLSRKFGCDPEMAVDVLDLAKRWASSRGHFVPRRFAAAQGEGVGPRAGNGFAGLP